MRIWLINPYGPLPHEAWREYSFTTMGNTLADAGHHVIWWTSNFSHHFKKFRSSGWQDIAIAELFTVRLVPTTGYSKNIGFGRIFRDLVFGLKTYWHARLLEKPDLIIYSESPLSLGYAGPALAKHLKCALVYDQMDLWPELIVKAFPQVLQRLVNGLFLPIYRRRASTYRRLDGVMALAQPYLDVVLAEAPHLRQRPHLLVYNGIDVGKFRRAMTGSVEDKFDLHKPSSYLYAIFAGSLGPSYDIATLVGVARRFERAAVKITIVIAGDGPLQPMVETAAQQCENIKYLGKLAPQKLAGIYGQCDVGLAAYAGISNVEMPDKFYDYAAAGLAIVNSLQGEVAGHIIENGLGLQYKAGDIDDLARCLQALAAEPARLAAMRQSSFEIGLQFDALRQYGQLPAFVERVIASATGSNASRDVR